CCARIEGRCASKPEVADEEQLTVRSAAHANVQTVRTGKRRPIGQDQPTSATTEAEDVRVRCDHPGVLHGRRAYIGRARIERRAKRKVYTGRCKIQILRDRSLQAAVGLKSED